MTLMTLIALKKNPYAPVKSPCSKKRKSTNTTKSKDTSNSKILEIEEDIAKVAKIFIDKHVSSNLGANTES